MKISNKLFTKQIVITIAFFVCMSLASGVPMVEADVSYTHCVEEVTRRQAEFLSTHPVIITTRRYMPNMICDYTSGLHGPCFDLPEGYPPDGNPFDFKITGVTKDHCTALGGNVPTPEDLHREIFRINGNSFDDPTWLCHNKVFREKYLYKFAFYSKKRDNCFLSPVCPECDDPNSTGVPIDIHCGACLIFQTCTTCEQEGEKLGITLYPESATCRDGYEKVTKDVTNSCGKKMKCVEKCRKKDACENYPGYYTNKPSCPCTKVERLKDINGKYLTCYKCVDCPPPPPPTDSRCPNPDCGDQQSWVKVDEEWVCTSWNLDTGACDGGYWKDVYGCKVTSCKRSCPNCVDQGASIYGYYNIKCSDNCSCEWSPWNMGTCGHHTAQCPPPVGCPSGSDGSTLTMGQLSDFKNTCYKDPYPREPGYGYVDCVDARPKPWDDNGKLPKTFQPKGNYGECGTGDKWCWRYKSCAEVTNGEWPDPYTGPSSTAIFVPDPAKRGDGTSRIFGARCGLYVPTSPPFWTLLRGNLFASGQVKNSLPDSYYGIGGGEDICSGVNSSVTTLSPYAAGIAMTNRTNSNDLFGSHVKKTQRSGTSNASKTSAYPAMSTLDSSERLKQDYDYFVSLIDWDAIPECSRITHITNGADLGGSPAHPDSHHYACKIVGSATTTNLNSLSSKLGNLTDSTNFTLFVEGSLNVNTPVITPNDTFKAFIVRGKLSFANDLGRALTSACSGSGSDRQPACTSLVSTTSTARDGSVQGVFIAGEVDIGISSRCTGDPDICRLNGNPTCDKQFNFAGVLAAFGRGDIELQRTFRGCNLTTNYCDLNYANPTHSFTYRPDFLINAPHWMRNTIKLRLETL